MEQEKEKPENDDENILENNITLESSRAQAEGQPVAGETQEDALYDILSQVPTEQISQIPSQAPTEQLAQEYKKLIEEFDSICVGNQKMEDQLDKIKRQWNP